MSHDRQFTLLYDGNCPLCSQEIKWLRSRDKNAAIIFQDIHEPGFKDKSPAPLTNLMAEIHGIDQHGHLLVGIDVFEVVYRLLGLNILAAPFRWRFTRPVMKLLYKAFAQYRPLLAKFSEKSTCRNHSCQRANTTRRKS